MLLHHHPVLKCGLPSQSRSAKSCSLSMADCELLQRAGGDVGIAAWGWRGEVVRLVEELTGCCSVNLWVLVCLGVPGQVRPSYACGGFRWHESLSRAGEIGS